MTIKPQSPQLSNYTKAYPTNEYPYRKDRSLRKNQSDDFTNCTTPNITIKSFNSLHDPPKMNKIDHTDIYFEQIPEFLVIPENHVPLKDLETMQNQLINPARRKLSPSSETILCPKSKDSTNANDHYLFCQNNIPSHQYLPLL